MPNYISLFLLSFFIFTFALSTKEGNQQPKEEFNPETERDNFLNIASYLGDQFTHIFPNYSKRFEPFETENPKVVESSKLIQTLIFENRSGGEHMFNLVISCKLKTHEYSMEIKEAKVSSIKNNLGVIDWNEFNYQISSYQIAIQNALMNKVLWRGKEMKVFTFYDVKSELMKKIPNLEIIMISNPNDNYNDAKFSYYMKVKDSYIGKLYLYTIPSQNTSCLLYTSPSPRDLSTSRMPSSA